MATPACFIRPFAWKIVLQPFSLRQCLSLTLRCISCMQQNAGYCLYIQSVILCLFVGELSPLMLRDIKESDCYFLLFLLLEMELCLCAYLLLGLLKEDYFLAFPRVQFPSLCCSLLSLVGLDLWKALCKFGFVKEYLGFSLYGN